jgi:hypothetical protein
MQIWSAEIKEIEKFHKSFTGQFPEIDKEMRHLIITDDPNVIMLYSRRCLEVIITDLCECELKRPRKTEPLKGVIEKLNKEGKVPSHIITSMDHLNGLSAYGTHPKDFDPEQVRPVLIYLATVFKWYLKYKNIEPQPVNGKSEKKGETGLREQEYSLTEKGIILGHNGPVNFDTIETLLINLKKAQEFKNINKTVAKRVYAIIVECLENISKHSLKKSGNENFPDPYLSVKKQQDEIIIVAGNPVSKDNKKRMEWRLNQINDLDEAGLKALYDEKINRQIKPENGAGLGFIIMALKSGSKIGYSFPEKDSPCAFVEIQIRVRDIFPKTLIIKQTSSSPRINFDLEKNIFEVSGESRPHDVPKFFEVVLNWLDQFSKRLDSLDNSSEPLVFNFNFEYFNSLSAKYILDLFKQLANIRLKGKNIIVKWYFEEDDMDMLEAGKEMSRIAKIPFEYIQKD